MRARDLQRAIFSPQWVARILLNFISGAQLNSNGANFDLIYLVLPLLYKKETRGILSKSRVTSTLDSLFTKNNNSYFLINISDSIYDFRLYTEQGLIYLGNIHNVDISSILKLDNPLKERERGKNIYENEMLKCAFNLGVVFSKSRVSEIFIKVGMQ